MGEMRCAYRFLVGKCDGRRRLKRPRPRYQDNVKIDIQELEWGSMGWIDVAWNKGRWLRVVNAVRTFGFHKMQGIFCLAENQLTSQEGLCSME